VDNPEPFGPRKRAQSVGSASNETALPSSSSEIVEAIVLWRTLAV
jgi:hypothetical protein